MMKKKCNKHRNVKEIFGEKEKVYFLCNALSYLFIYKNVLLWQKLKQE